MKNCWRVPYRSAKRAIRRSVGTGLGELRQDFVERIGQVLEAHDEFAVHLVPAVAADEEAQFVRRAGLAAEPAAEALARPPAERAVDVKNCHHS